MQRVLIIGAASAIAEATARVYAARGAALFLVGRDAERLAGIAADLSVRGAAKTAVRALDVNVYEAHQAVLDAAWSEFGEIDLVLIAHGTLPDQPACEASVELALREFSTNGLSTIALATAIAPRLKAGATLAAISSVAGDRGRASNYLYGSAKAAVSTFFSGLRQRLNADGINVLTIKPGFVDTPMTQSFKKGALWAKPDQVAHGIAAAVDRRRGVAYLPWFWWGIMQVIKNIPEFVFRRVKL
ncbi:SDR family oxidoreductase [Lysobacter sp. BMK333-48F3]|uniref:SDR family oxidoreductase n=1 Tax=Lysobacter sp. BMK333-48F3 TaxID=2867962 RepID=UPI001C8C43B5|nr:SDR family oxidoreductase [Lysobacter sp. BMK333-48F3]MBX9400126.1 SDR family oxidoreductase [Lysobacter sp. BMK333-48F3]